VSDLALLAVVGAAVVAGALVQGTIGLGLGLVAAPVVTLADPGLMPDLMLWLAAALPVLTLAREWRHVDRRGLLWALAGRVPGTAIGVAVVTLASDRALGLAVGGMVLVAVAASLRDVRVRARRRSLLAAGVVSGAAGTATSIGGPPVALVLQHRPGPVVRATLGAYFAAGALMSLAGLALAGEVSRRPLLLAAALLPGLAIGFALAQPVRRRVDAGRLRPAILAVCAVSAAVLIVRSALG
jgi:uncharacterized membrane protein YfcA